MSKATGVRLLTCVLIAALLCALPSCRTPFEDDGGSTTVAKPFDPKAGLPTTAVPRPEPIPLESADVEAGFLAMGRMHKDRGEYDKARRALEDLIRTSPLNVEGHYVLAWVCVELGDLPAARAEFTATMNLTVAGSEMHTEAQQALDRMGY